MQAPSALAADLPRSEALTVALMQGYRKAENTALDDRGRYSQPKADVDDYVSPYQPGWLAGSPTDLTDWVMPGDDHRWPTRVRTQLTVGVGEGSKL